MKQGKFYLIKAAITVGILVSGASLIYAGIHDHSQMNPSQHQPLLQSDTDAYKQRQVAYKIPETTLINQHGRRVALSELFGGTEPLMVNFIFTSCNTICPVLTATFSQVQKRFGPELKGMRMISISIDPDYDTPARLREYARRFRASEDWIFLTGDLDTVTEVLNAFEAYRGDKMNHVPLTLLRRDGDEHWLRVEGFPGSEDLYQLMSNNR